MFLFNQKLNYTYQELPSLFYKQCNPEFVKEAQIIKYNEDYAKELGIEININEEILSSFLSGNKFINDKNTIAQAYAGHQFNHFNMLGDGRALLLGNINHNNKNFDVQLKGAGKTPFSRGGDGKALLGSMMREYIISEALAGLNIPTTRSLAITSANPVFRNKYQKGAVLTRVATSFIRCGTMEYAFAYGKDDDVKLLADYLIKYHYPNINTTNKYEGFFIEIMLKQAQLVALWQSYGFIHGVMNTDNMSLVGESIDFGPCAFMDKYNSNQKYSSIDYYSRYAYNQQPIITKSNLGILGNAMSSLITNTFIEQSIASFDNIYQLEYEKIMLQRLGLTNDDKALLYQLLNILEENKLDYNNTFVFLSYNQERNDLQWQSIAQQYLNTQAFMAWYQEWLLKSDKSILKKVNPQFIARNHLVEEAIFLLVERQDITFFNQFVESLKNPFKQDDSILLNRLQSLPPAIMDDYVTYCQT